MSACVGITFLYFVGCAVIGTWLARLANNELDCLPDPRRSRAQLVLLPAVWLLWPLLFVVVLVAGLAMGLAEVVQVFKRAFPKEKR